MECNHNCSECEKQRFCLEVQHAYFNKRFNKLAIIMGALIIVDLCEFIALILK